MNTATLMKINFTLMVSILNFSCMFASLIQNKLPDAKPHEYKAEIKITGRQRVESTPVYYMHRMFWVSSDLPIFSLFYSYIMLTDHSSTVSTSETGTNPVEPTIMEILDNFFLTTNAKIANRTLRDMFVMAISSEESDVLSLEDRADMAFIFREISDLIEDLEPHYRATLPKPKP